MPLRKSDLVLVDVPSRDRVHPESRRRGARQWIPGGPRLNLSPLITFFLVSQFAVQASPMRAAGQSSTSTPPGVMYYDVKTHTNRGVAPGSTDAQLLTALQSFGLEAAQRVLLTDSGAISLGRSAPIDPKSAQSTSSFGSPTLVSPTVYPYSSAARVYSYYGPQARSCHADVGSGVMIDAWHVLTCLHVVYQLESLCGTQLIDSALVTPAYTDGWEPFGHAHAAGVLWFSNYFTDPANQGNYDIALVQLDRPVGALAGWRPFGWRTCPSSSVQFAIDGYSAVPGDGARIYETVGGINLCTLSQGWISSPYAYAGSSGSGLSALSGGTVYGVQYGSDPSDDLRAICPITASMFGAFNSQIGTVTSAATDLVALQAAYTTVAADGTVQPGATLNNWGFTIYNSSTSAFSGPVTYSAYLSLDRFDDTFDVLVAQRTSTLSFGPHVTFVGTVASLPVTIPPTWTYGSYFLKVRITTPSDVNASNNLTHGSDAIAVARYRNTCTLSAAGSFLAATPHASPWKPASTPTFQPAIAVDGQVGGATQQFQWLQGSSHVIYAVTPVPLDSVTQYAWKSWSNGGANPQTVALFADSTYSATYARQFPVSISSSSHGSVDTPSDWYFEGQQIWLAAVPDSGYHFAGWVGTGTGSYTGAANPALVTANGAISELANFTPLVGVGERSLAAIPVLRQNSPNPFGSTTTIDFELPRPAAVSLELYDLGGRLITTLASGRVETGQHRYAWAGTDAHGTRLAAGIYAYVLRTGGLRLSKRLVLLP